MDAYGHGQIVEHGLNLDLHLHPMGTDHQDHTGAYGQGQMGEHGLNLDLHLHPMGTDHQDHTGTHDQVQIDPYHRSEIDSYQSSYMNPPDATNIDDLITSFQFCKPIRTRGNQSPRAGPFHDGSYTARADRSGYQNPDVQEQMPFLDTSKLNTKKLSRKPRRPREHRDE